MVAVVEQRRACADCINRALILLSVAQSYADVLPAKRYAVSAATLRKLTAELGTIRDTLQR
jgi:hypothetical protein